MEDRDLMMAQCKAVAHLAQAVANVHTDKAAFLATAPSAADRLVGHLGPQTAAIMETLGDILNDMDAVDEEEDAWVTPIFAAARARWGASTPRLTPDPETGGR